MKWSLTRRSFPWAGEALIGVAACADIYAAVRGLAATCDTSNGWSLGIMIAFVSGLLAVMSAWLRAPETPRARLAVRLAPALTIASVVLSLAILMDQFKACI